MMLTPRRAVIELDTRERYETDVPYTLCVNGISVQDTRVVRTISGLLPGQTNQVVIERDGRREELALETPQESVTLNVRAMNAAGDGVHDDTAAIQAAIAACPPGGRVLIPEGTYCVTSLFLKDHLILELAKGAVLRGSKNRRDVPVLPGIVQCYNEEDELNLGTWEGNPLDCFAALITGIGVKNTVICGEGTIDGNASEQDWWQDDRAKILAFRPRSIFLNRCEHVFIEGITITNSPSWTIHPYFTKDISILNVRLENPWDSPNTDGIDPESVNGLTIAGVYFSLGDDCIAIKSGKAYMGKKYAEPSQNISIRHCYMRNGQGAVSIGSENSGGVYHVRAESCVFDNTDRGLRIKTRRGRGKNAVVEDIVFDNIEMDNVRTPVVVNCFYNCCDPDRHTEYVRTKEPLPVDERTPSVHKLEFRHIQCTNCHVAAAFVYGLPENPIDCIELEDFHVTYAQNPIAMEPAMMDDIDEESTWLGACFHNVERLVLRDVTIGPECREPLVTENIKELIKE